LNSIHYKNEENQTILNSNSKHEMTFYQPIARQTQNLSNKNQINDSLLSQIPLINSIQQYERTKVLFDDLINNYFDELSMINYNFSKSNDSYSSIDPVEKIENDLKMYCIQNCLI
jgi:hypothetical protein